MDVPRPVCLIRTVHLQYISSDCSSLSSTSFLSVHFWLAADYSERVIVSNRSISVCSTGDTGVWGWW